MELKDNGSKAAGLTQIWQEYQEGIRYLNSLNLFTRVEECYQMVNGDQWHGLKAGEERPAQLNILAGIMKNSTALVGQNNMTIYYSPLTYGTDREQLLQVCAKLNGHANKTWEQLKLDKLLWQILQESFISGDSFAYFYQQDSAIAMELIDNTAVMLADEQNPNLQEQPYILIVQRRYVSDVREEAQLNGLTEDEIELIIADDDLTGQIKPNNDGREVNNEQKILSVLKLWKDGGNVHIARSTKAVIYQPDTEIPGMTLYPIACYSWKPQKGSARGLGDIWDKIPNQISINKNLYRFESAVKNNAYPHKVYQEGSISGDEVAKLAYPDSNIAVRDFNGQGIGNIISYLQPANISSYAQSIWQDILTLTKELSGAGDNLENVDPEQASGAAIVAARDAKLLNVNMQMAGYKQFIEDIALIWYDMWLAYNPNGLSVILQDEAGNEYEEIIPVEILQDLKIGVKIDVAPNNPYSKLAHESGLKELFASGAITLEEYVEALDDDSSMPKAKLQAIVEKRQKQQAMFQAQQSEAVAMQGQEQTAGQKLIELTQALQGGDSGEVLQETPQYGNANQILGSSGD